MCATARDAGRAHWLDRLMPVSVGVVTFIALSATLRNGFVEWDDPVLITGNEAYRGLGWRQISWMFGNILMGHYVPITWLTLGLDYVLWGMRPAGYHLTNLLLHAANAAMFWLVALRLLTAATRLSSHALHVAATATALFFALHPLRAESVAWITERRDVLSGFFFFLTILLYLHSARQRGHTYWVWQGLAWLTYLLAILSKSIVMTLPVVLIVLDFYPLRRLGPDWRSWLRRPAWLVWREKIPFVALGLLAALLGYYGQAANRYLTSLDQVHWTDRPALVFYSVWFYVAKTFLPLGLAPLYELPARVDPLAWTFLGPALGVVAITVTVLALRRRWPAGLAVWISYGVMIAPVSGAVHAGHQLAHDRYSYLSCLGWALLVGAAVGAFVQLVQRRALTRVVAHAGTVALAAAFLGLAVLGSQQVEAWRDTETLWRTAIDARPDCAICEQNLGVHLFKQNLLDAARGHYERALALRPDRIKFHYNLGLVFAQVNDLPRATVQFARVVKERPDDVQALMNLGVALMKQRRAAEGLVHLRRAMMLKPDDSLVLSNLGLALTETGNAAAAVGVLQRAVASTPDAAGGYHALMRAHLALGNVEAARTAHDALGRIDPARARALAPLLAVEW
ncbi:MAG: tetratricopeptide repeat protein [Candidatus Rokubacteria bacterium]|nr:tetratricopeptide repeat protein [Candidatus Rokubacteria bacterium]